MVVITENAALREFCARVAKCETITVDTEFIRDKTYWPKLCLVQVAGENEAAAIDALAPDIDLAPLLALMNAPSPLKVFHAARQDFEIFYLLSGRLPAPVFDSQVAAMVSVNDLADRPPKALADGETLSLGRHVVEWYDAPHLPHGWDCGYLGDTTTGTLFCGDLFTQAGADLPPITEGDILEPSEAMRASMDYFSHSKNAGALIDRLASTKPKTLACMHGSSWRGDGEKLLRALGEALAR